MLSPSDTALIFVVALLLFGPEQMPKIARQVGELMRKMQSTTQSFMLEMERSETTDEARVDSEPQDVPPLEDQPPASQPPQAGSAGR